MSYQVEADFMHEGNRCVVIALDAGHRCGYVGIPSENVLYDKEYDDQIKELDRGITPSRHFIVHGGITYAGGGLHSKYPVKSDLWWFGFDCDHYGDAKDFSIMDDRHKLLFSGGFDYGTIKDKNYCISNCKKLSEQLNEFILSGEDK